MKTGRQLLFVFVTAILLASPLLVMPKNQQVSRAQESDGCPPPEFIAAQRELVENFLDEFVAVRAYKDATLNELARLNTLYYSLRGELLRALVERSFLLREREEILANNPLAAEDFDRLIEIEDGLLELSVLLESANESVQEQLLLLSVLWQPVADLLADVSVERYERFTQRILEVREGEGRELIALAQGILDLLADCEIATPEPGGGVGGGVGGGGGTRPTRTPTPIATPIPGTPIPSTPNPSGVGS